VSYVQTRPSRKDDNLFGPFPLFLAKLAWAGIGEDLTHFAGISIWLLAAAQSHRE